MESTDAKVSDVMIDSLHIVDGLETIENAIAKMKRLNVSSLIIERRHEGDEYGVVTVQDIAAHVVAVNRAASRTSVYEIMTKPALTVGPDMRLKYAIRLLARMHFRLALVTNGRELLGLVSLRDMVLNYADSQQTANTSGGQ